MKTILIELTTDCEDFNFIKEDISQELACCSNSYEIQHIKDVGQHGDLIDRDRIKLMSFMNFTRMTTAEMLGKEPVVLEANNGI